MIRFTPVTSADLPKIKEIYDHYILHTTATFHRDALSLSELAEIISLDNPRYPSFLIRDDDVIIGYWFLSRYKKRQADDRTAELSIYLKPEYTGKGIGCIAMQYLEKAAAAGGIKVLIGTLCSENHASIRMLEKMGYTKAAHLTHVGEKFGTVLDVVMFLKELGS